MSDELQKFDDQLKDLEGRVRRLEDDDAEVSISAPGPGCASIIIVTVICITLYVILIAYWGCP